MAQSPMPQFMLLLLLLPCSLTGLQDFSLGLGSGGLGGRYPWEQPPAVQGSGGDVGTFAGFDWNWSQDPQSSPSGAALFSSLLQSSKSNSKRSRTEQTSQEVLTHSQSSEWTRGFQDNGNGGLQRLDSSSSQEKTSGRSAKDLKASESGESRQRDQRLTQVNGKTVLSTDTGKESSFSNGGEVSNHTQFSSESSSNDNRLVKALLPPPPPPLPPPPPTVATCFRRQRPSLVFLVHAASDAEAFFGGLDFLDAFLQRLEPVRALLVFFNSLVLDVVDYPAEVARRELRARLEDAAHSLRGRLSDDCDLAAAAQAAERLRRQLRLAAPCSLVVLAPGGLRASDRELAAARDAANFARRSFDQLTAIAGRPLQPPAADLLGLFATGGGSGLLALRLGGGLTDAESADLLGRRVCEVGQGGPARFEGFAEEPGRLQPGF